MHCRDRSHGAGLLDDRTFAARITRAMGAGVTFLDTSDAYGLGRSERLLGRLLADHPDRPVRVSSKVGRVRGTAAHPYAGRRVSLQLQQTLDNLGLERLAVYTLESTDFGEDDRYLVPVVEQLRTLRELGYIGAIGLRVVDGRQGPCAEAVARARRMLFLLQLIRPDVIWTEFDALLPARAFSPDGRDLLSFAAEEGMAVFLAVSTGARLPADAAGPESRALAALRRSLGERAGRLLLRYVVRQADCTALAGMKADTEELRRLMETPLPPEDLARVADAYGLVRRMLAVPGVARPNGLV
ncbi:aldo/keto reductase [Streptomyces sp. NPDC091377]|uniref:aldo/keto reductase n=1 Tax=Streptomyces sp. NPDC091377 TaxID=3365995 RepID=UPI00382A6E16